MTTFGKRLVQAAEEARAIARGEMGPARVYVPEDVDVKAIRQDLKMTQAEFSNTFGFPLPTLRDWEQRKSRPDTSARAFLVVISKEPKRVMHALAGGRASRKPRTSAITDQKRQAPTRRMA